MVIYIAVTWQFARTENMTAHDNCSTPCADIPPGFLASESLFSFLCLT